MHFLGQRKYVAYCCSVTKWCLTLCDLRTIACQTPLSFTVSWSFLKVNSTEPWCYLTISSSATPFSFCLQSFPASCSISMSWLCINQVAKILALQLRQQSFQHICNVDFFYNWLVWSPCCPRESQESSPKFKSINYLVLSLLYGPTLNPNMTIGETMTLTIWTFVDKVMSLLFKMLSRFVIAFLPRSKCLLNSWLQLSTAEILGPKKVESVIASTFPHLFAMNCWDKMPWS